MICAGRVTSFVAVGSRSGSSEVYVTRKAEVTVLMSEFVSAGPAYSCLNQN